MPQAIENSWVLARWLFQTERKKPPGKQWGAMDIDDLPV
jgi:hypothetical protein